MSKSATAQIKQSVAVGYTNTTGGVNYSGTPSITKNLSLTNQDIDKVYANAGTLSAPVSIDLAAAVDPFGETLEFEIVKGIYVSNQSESEDIYIDGSLIGGDQYTVGFGSVLFQNTEWVVTPSTTQLTLTPTGSLSYQVIIVGA
jgi:hypothetical protein